LNELTRFVLYAAEQRESYDRRLASTNSVVVSPVVNGGLAPDLPQSPEFKLRDPRIVFHDFFGGKDPFSEVFGIPGDYFCYSLDAVTVNLYWLKMIEWSLFFVRSEYELAVTVDYGVMAKCGGKSASCTAGLMSLCMCNG